MALYLIPGFGAGAQYFNNQGVVLSGGKLYTYVAGSVSTPLATYTDSTGGTLNANPIILDSSGRLSAGIEIWCSVAVKFTLTDSLNNILGSWDNVQGLNNVGTSSQLEYFLSGLTPTYVSGTQFTVTGNQLSIFTVDRRVRYSINTGVYYGYVTSSSFDGVVTTTVNIAPDVTALNNTLYQIDYAFLSSVNPSIPEQYVQQGGPFNWCGTATGTANALALTPVLPGLPVLAYQAGQLFRFKAGASANTTAATFNVSGIGPIAIQSGGGALVGGEIQPSMFYELYLDTTTTGQLMQIMPASGSAGPSDPYADITNTADAFTGSFTVLSPVLRDGMHLRAGVANPNTTTTPTFAPTLNGVLQTARTIVKFNASNTEVALAVGDMQGDAELVYDLPNTKWILQNPLSVTTSTVSATGNITTAGNFVDAVSVALTAASTTNIGAAASNNITINGTTTITAFDTVGEGLLKYVTWAAATPVTYNITSMQLINGISRTNNVGDFSLFRSLGSGNWREEVYQPNIPVPAGALTGRQTVLMGPIDVAGVPALFPQTVTGLNLTSVGVAVSSSTVTNTVTFTNGSPIIAWTGHVLNIGQAVSFTNSGGGLPTNFSVGVVYYVVATGFTANQFEVAATPGGTAISAGSAGTGTQTVWGGENYPLTVTAQSGFSLSGQNNLVGRSTSNLTWTGLTNTNTNYLYVLVATNGVLTTGFTTVAPIVQYENITSPSVTSGQITINLGTGDTYLGNGSTAAETPLVLLGTATTSGGNITATQTYIYNKPQTGTARKSGSLLKRTAYTTAGSFTWVKSAGCTSVNVKVQGGNGAGGTGGQGGIGSTFGGGGGGGGSGGEGGYSEGLIDASLFNQQTITIAAGGTSSFGALISSTSGGTGGNGANGSNVGNNQGGQGGVGGSGGTGSGGDLNITGRAGSNGCTGGSGDGSANAGAGGVGGHGGLGSNGGTGGVNGVAGSAGAAATAGWIEVEEYA